MVTSVLQMFSNIFETDNVHYVYGKIMRDETLVRNSDGHKQQQNKFNKVYGSTSHQNSNEVHLQFSIYVKVHMVTIIIIIIPKM